MRLEERGGLCCIIDLAVLCLLMKRRLGVALGANGDVLARGDIAEINGGLKSALRVALARGNRARMILRGTVAHFTVDSTFAKLEIVPARGILFNGA